MPEPSATDVAQATAVLQAFMDASRRGDLPGMLQCVTARTAAAGKLNASPDDVVIVLGAPRPEGEQLIIPIKALPPGAPEGAAPLMEMACLMVREDGQWKFDLATTAERMAPALEEAVGQMATAVGAAMGEAMQGVGQALADGLQQAFGQDESAASPEQDWSTASLTPTSKELLPVPMMWKNLPKTQAAVREALGSRTLVTSDMKTILQRAGSDEPDTLFNWFEDQLFAGWPAMLAQVAQTVPLANRLRAIRIEAAQTTENRMLAIDGSDLIYRMILPYKEGFYQDDEVATLLPGVLAGLPETIDTVVTGFRLLPWDDQSVDLDLYRQYTAPRYMRRICDLLGRHVALEADWDDIGQCTDSGRALTWWGLNRVFGGIAYACLDPARRAELNGGLTRIHLVSTLSEPKGYARYADGVLEFGFRPYGGTDSGCYEHEIAAALAGASAAPEAPPAESAEAAEPAEGTESGEADQPAKAAKPAKSTKRRPGRRPK